MDTPLLTLTLRHKRDLLRARQVTRQAADLLGFDAADQTCLAAAAFHLACQAHAPAGRATMLFELTDDCLQISCTPRRPALPRKHAEPPAPMRLCKHLPAEAAIMREDVPWMLHQLAKLAPVNVFDEMRKVNQELLRALLELAACRAGLKSPRREPSAA